MKFIDFFAGVGGFRRGLELSGHKCVGFCEWDKYATASYTSMHLISEDQRKYLQNLSLKQRQKEILKDEYRNGEWYSNDIRNVDARNLPYSDCWTFGAPCQDFSIAGKRAGLEGDRSSLVREIFRILEELKEEDRPEWLIYENVKGMLSSNRGLDYLSILSEMDRLGYDIEWQNINSKWWVPQNRERIYTIGHLRRYGSAKIFPVTGTDGENSFSIKGIGNTNPSGKGMNGNVFSNSVISPTILSRDARQMKQVAIKIIGKINSSQDGKIHDIYGIAKCHSSGHNNNPKVAIPVLTPERENKSQNGRRFKENGDPMFTLTAQDRHGVALEIKGIYDFYNKKMLNNEYVSTLTSNTGLSTTHCGTFGAVLKIKEATKQGYAIASEGDSINLSVPESKTRRGRVEKRVVQTLDTSCNQGVIVCIPAGYPVYAVWYEKYKCYISIRKLTPKECFRLQGWTDDYFEKAAFVNSDSQLYKQAGNGVTVDVVRAIGEKISEFEIKRFEKYMNKPEKEESNGQSKPPAAL